MASPYLSDARAVATAAAALRGGLGERRATFEVRFEALPKHFAFVVIAGVEEALRALEAGPLSAAERSSTLAVVGGVEALLDRLAAGPLRIDVDAALDGTIAFANEPVATLEGPYADVLLAAHVVRACIERGTAAATGAARCVAAGNGKRVVDGASALRSAMDAEAVVRAAYVGGVSSTTALAVGARLGVPIHSEPVAHLILRTAASATSASATSASATSASADGGSWGAREQLVEIADDDAVAILAMHQRDDATGFVATGFDVSGRVHARIDLVALEDHGAWAPMLGVDGDASVDPGRKLVVRYVNEHGTPVGDVIHLSSERIQPPDAVSLIGPLGAPAQRLGLAARAAPLASALWRAGRRLGAAEPLTATRLRAIDAVRALPPALRRLRGAATYPVGLSPKLAAQKAELMASHHASDKPALRGPLREPPPRGLGRPPPLHDAPVHTCATRPPLGSRKSEGALPRWVVVERDPIHPAASHARYGAV